MKRLREVVLIVFGLMGILALARQALEPDELEAVAIPNAQEDVDIDFQHFTNTGLSPVANTFVTINNGDKTRKVIIQFSAEARTDDPDDWMEVTYDFNGGGCFPQAGPHGFANSYRLESHTAIHVPTLGPGTWRIQPCVKMMDGNSNGVLGVVGARTLTAEVMTK